jgi:glutaredoxin 3
MSEKRKVEVFIAGCPLCDETVKIVKGLACPSCDVIIYDLRNVGMDKAREYGVNSVPTVVVNGKILDCCKRGKPTEEDLKAAGIGAPLLGEGAL